MYKKNAFATNCKFYVFTYLALLYKYSGGITNNTESTGRFGTGFFVTHSLPLVIEGKEPNIDEDGSIYGFEVIIYRNGNNNEELIEGIKKWKMKKNFGEIKIVGGLNINIYLRLKEIKNKVI